MQSVITLVKKKTSTKNVKKPVSAGLLLSWVFVISESLDCNVNDVLKTRGECVYIKECNYMLGKYRVGGAVTRCGANGNVCCPKTDSLAEQKCSEYRELLHVPQSFTLPRSEEPICANGDSNSFIVGGREALPNEYPHAVSLGYGSDKSKLKFLCGATLISDKFVLTAAHCVTNQRTGKPSYAVIGDTILDPVKENTTPSTYRMVIKIDKHIVHPGYKPPLIYNDIALLSLSTPVELSRWVLPACVGSPLTTPKTTPKKHVNVEAIGWGITEVSSQKTSNKLQATNLTTVDSGTCNSIYGLEPDKGFRYPEGIVKTQMCATGEDRDTCRGDSGGGLLTREGKCVFHVVGVTSIGSKVCGLGSPAVYTNVASYQDWIEAIVWR